MEWQWVLIAIFSIFILTMASGMPVAFVFISLNIIGVVFYFHGGIGISQFVENMFDRLTTFSLAAIPLFVLMGEILFRSGIAARMMDALDGLMGRMPGRLALQAVAGGTLFGALSGESIASIAMLGDTLLPEMEKRGYKKPMSLGPILGSAGLATMIPPSALAVIMGIIAMISVGKILIGIILPGVLMAILYGTYVIGRCWLQPYLAPTYKLHHSPWSDRLSTAAIHILPSGFIIFAVTGLIFLGVASPSEAAATGVVSTFIIAAVYRRLSWETVKKSLIGTADITAMVMLIIATSATFSNILARSGATQGLAQLAITLSVPPIVIIIAMLVVSIILGMFMSVVAIMMILLPLFIPVVVNMGYSEIWFAVMFLLTVEMGGTSPPFGLLLFTLKRSAPSHVTMTDLYWAGIPFLICDAIAVILIVALPQIALWLPGQMY